MTTRQILVDEIFAFLAATGMAPGTFGHKTANDGKFVDRLRNGGSMTLETAERVRLFIRENSEPTSHAGKRKRSRAA
jgi:hypothetical protein